MSAAQSTPHDREPLEQPALSLSSLSYISRASEPPTEADIQDLLADARLRNRELGVTGLLLYEHGRFFQWLEGPPPGVSEVWRSIRRDRRHDQVELLSDRTTPGRMFGGWDMLWLRRKGALDTNAAIPDVADADVAELARLAVAADEAALADLVGSLLPPNRDVKTLYAALFEPAARLLGDWWREDACSELDVTVALGALQTLARRLLTTAPRKPKLVTREILVVPQPHEMHMLDAALVGDFFADARWNVSLEFPRSDQELVRRVAKTRFDVVYLSLSNVFGREHRLPEMRATIAALRDASLNPDLVIAVGGRAFATDKALAAATVDADVGVSSSAEAVAEIGLALVRRLSPASGSGVASRTDTRAEMMLRANLPPGWHMIPDAPGAAIDGPDHN
jgi:hypothetical protein